MLKIDEKIEIIEAKILEAKRVILNVEFPSQEEIEAQEEAGIRQSIINQVYEQRQIIKSLNAVKDELKGVANK